jgi:SAM-dependent methyltransferase
VRASFDDAAALYDRARPGYPNQVFEDLAKSAALRLGSRVLEIGCGTGQAMLPLAERGYRVVAVELGERLAAVARKKLAAFPCVEVAVAAFESWPLPPEPFEAVAAATSSHWLDPEARLPRAAAALRPGGVLATIATHHVAGGTHDFFLEVQPCYERWDPRTPPRLHLPAADAVPHQVDELDESDLFEPPIFRRYEWEQNYTTATYLEVLGTYSTHLTLEPDARAHLEECIARFMDERFGGAIRKRYLTELRLARLRPR